MRKDSSSIRNIYFHNPRLARLGSEVLTLAELRERAPSTLTAPQRVDFHLLLMVENGCSQHLVDFVELSLKPGSVLFVRPGQVQQWKLDPSLEGYMLLIRGDALAPSIVRAGSDMTLIRLEEWPAHIEPPARLFAKARDSLIRLREDITAFDGSENHAALISHNLLSLLLTLAQCMLLPNSAIGHREADIHRLFTTELEQHFTQRLSVLDYAKRLGYSQSTISRASVAVTGHTAKEAIDRRIALEAKRLLVHSNTTVAYIAHQLGFAEATNFVKFFKRREGLTPLEYRSKTLGNLINQNAI